jgi:hypothetical protein
MSRKQAVRQERGGNAWLRRKKRKNAKSNRREFAFDGRWKSAKRPRSVK